MLFVTLSGHQRLPVYVFKLHVKPSGHLLHQGAFLKSLTMFSPLKKAFLKTYHNVKKSKCKCDIRVFFYLKKTKNVIFQKVLLYFLIVKVIQWLKMFFLFNSVRYFKLHLRVFFVFLHIASNLIVFYQRFACLICACGSKPKEVDQNLRFKNIIVAK